MNKVSDIEKVKSLKYGDNNTSCTVSWSEGGGGLVYRIEDMYVLFYVPQYGGEPQYENAYHESEISELIEKARSWT